MTNNSTKILAKVQAVSFYIVIAIAVITEIVLMVIAVPPRLQNIFSNQIKFNSLSLQSRDLESAVQTVTSIDKTRLDGYLQKSTIALPDEKKTAGIVSGLSNVASSAGIIVRDLELTPGLLSSSSARTPSVRGLKYVPAALLLSSDLPSLAKFVNSLRNTSQVLGVSELHYVSSGNYNSVEIGVQIFYLPPSEGPVEWKQLEALTSTELDLLDGLSDKDLFTVPPEKH
jgi:hypothetical protein